ncbi:MAG TPA: hypothetical protein VF058_10080 [Actinomycetota bacterium]
MKLAPTREHPAPVAPGEVVLAPPQRRRGLSRRLVLVTVVLALVAGGVGGYVAYLVSEDGLTRGRATDAARWEAMGDAHLRDQVALARGRAAEAARWQALADAIREGTLAGP